MTFSTFLSQCRLWVIAGLLYLHLVTAAVAESKFETRYQYYQEQDGRMRVDSDYSLFSVDLSDTLVLDGTLLTARSPVPRRPACQPTTGAMMCRRSIWRMSVTPPRWG